MITINLQNPTPEEVDALRDIFSEGGYEDMDSISAELQHFKLRVKNAEKALEVLIRGNKKK